MRKPVITHVLTTCIAAFFAIMLVFSCNDSTDSTEDDKKEGDQPKEMSESDKIKRGDYIMTIAGCHDCHSPKKFGPHGFTLDSTKLLSGHPANSPYPPLDKKALQPGNWVLIYPDITAFVGPWGMSFAANLTPDTATGIGNWTEATFMKALRTGKHMGLDEGRPIMPPMPWEMVARMTDEDLKSVFAFLRSIPAVSNRVPGYLPPPEVQKMK